MPFREKNLKMFVSKVFSLLGIHYHLSDEEQKLHFGTHCVYKRKN